MVDHEETYAFIVPEGTEIQLSRGRLLPGDRVHVRPGKTPRIAILRYAGGVQEAEITALLPLLRPFGHGVSVEQVAAVSGLPLPGPALPPHRPAEYRGPPRLTVLR